MRLFGIDEGNDFTEYQPERFKDKYYEEKIEVWLEQNSESIVENGGLLILGRQVTTNLNTSIDLLGVDRDGNLAVVELKRDKTPRDTLAQALEYASFAVGLSGDQLEDILRQYTSDENASLVEYHRAFFALSEDDAVSFNKNQRLIIVGSGISQPVRQSALFLRQKGIPVTCLEFRYFKAGGGEQLLSVDTVVGLEPLVSEAVSTGSLPKTTEAAFLAACDDAGRAVFEPLLTMAKKEGFSINWGSRGFSFTAKINVGKVVICYCYPKPSRPNQTPQSFWAGFTEISKKVEGSEQLIEEFKRKFQDTGLFEQAGGTIKCLVETKPSPEQVAVVVGLFRDLALGVMALAGQVE